MLINDYLKKYDLPINQDYPFNKVDQIILCQMTMTSYEKLNKKDFFVREILEMPDFETCFQNMLTPDDQLRFYRKYLFSKRFRNLKVIELQEAHDKEKQLQFCAFTYVLPNDTLFIAFRGTDISVTGWIEDFNLSIYDEVPAQTLARKYVDNIISKYQKKVYIGGHSKGANLALYASIKSKYKDFIINVFDNDGPGFKDDIFNDSDYLEIKERVYKVVPRSSIVGLLMRNDNNYRVIESVEKGPMQHSPFSWKITNNDFVYAFGIDINNKITKDFFLKLLNNSTTKQREEIFASIGKILELTDINNLNDIKNNWLDSAYKILNNKESRKTLTTVFNTIFPVYKESVKDNSRLFSRCFYCGHKLKIEIHEDNVYYTCEKCNRVFLELTDEMINNSGEVYIPKLKK